MNIEAMPIIRLTVEGMKHQILAYIGANGSELGDKIEAEVTKAINSYPWDKDVEKIVHELIEEAVIRFFKYGKGGVAIDKAISEAFGLFEKSQ